MTIVEVDRVSKYFRRKSSRKLLRDHVRGLLSPQKKDLFQALKDVSFRVQSGESVALIGPNGAGKSTLLALICGLVKPDEGSVTVRGTVSPLLELAAGFHPDLTGRENALLNAALNGLTRREALERLPAIVDFSELHGVMDEPIRTYSSGMVLRLGFAVAVHCDPSLIVIDEVLAVGDASFQAKCHQKILEFRAAGKTLLFVSHSTAAVKDLCDRAIWLQKGQIAADGPVNETVAQYESRLAAP